MFLTEHLPRGVVHINNTLKLLGFEDLDIKEFKIDESEIEIHIHIKLRVKPCECKKCGTINKTLHSIRENTILHHYFTNKKCVIHYYKNRLKCTSCRTTYFEDNPFVHFKRKLSDETVISVLRELKQNQSFIDIAKKVGISTTEAINIFDEHIHMYREPLSEIMGIDEFKNLSTGRGKYACIVTSIDRSSVIDVIEDRTIETLSRYFSIIDREERKKVKYYVSDMYDGYKYIHDIYFPDSIHVIDTFHFVRLFTEAFNRIRIRIMKSYSVNSQEYSLMKDYWKTLMMPGYKLHKNKSYYQRFERSLNQKELLNIILGKDDQLYHAYLIKEDFVCNYYKVKFEDAENYINKLIGNCKNSMFPEYIEVAKSLKKWKQQIINSFIRDKDGKRITNAKTEGFNNSVKVIKRTSYGYANFKRFRNRILYILRDYAPIKI